MYIGFLSNYFPSLTETFIYREAFELKRNGFKLKFFSLRKPDSKKISKEALIFYNNTFYLLPMVLSHFIKSHFKFFFMNPYKYINTCIRMINGTHKNNKDRVRSFLHFAEGVVLANKMIEESIQHVHAHYASQAASVARVIYLLTNITYSISAHAHDIWYDQLLLPEKLNEAIFISCCSDFGRKWLLKQSKNDLSHKIMLIYHGLDVEKFVPPNNERKRKKNLILSIGRLTEQKGFSDLIEACSILNKENYQFYCIIIGEGELRQKLEEQIVKNNLLFKVKLMGAMYQDKIKKYYDKAWIFVLPCVDTKDGNRDGIPNVILESMAKKLPVITTDNSGQPEIIENGVNGILVSPHSPKMIAEAIKLLSNNNVLREKIKVNAYNKITKDFNNKHTIKPLIIELNKIVKCSNKHCE